MDNPVIIFSQDGNVHVSHPGQDALVALGIEAIAKAVVPVGLPYKVIDASELPANRDQRMAWTVDPAELTDGVGADYGEGSSNAIIHWSDDGAPVTERFEQNGDEVIWTGEMGYWA